MSDTRKVTQTWNRNIYNQALGTAVGWILINSTGLGTTYKLYRFILSQQGDFIKIHVIAWSLFMDVSLKENKSKKQNKINKKQNEVKQNK